MNELTQVEVDTADAASVVQYLRDTLVDYLGEFKVLPYDDEKVLWTHQVRAPDADTQSDWLWSDFCEMTEEIERVLPGGWEREDSSHVDDTVEVVYRKAGEVTGNG